MTAGQDRANMTIGNLAGKARDLYLTMWRYRNWRQILTSVWKGQPPTRIVLRDGTCFHSPADNILLSMVDEIFYKHVYTPPGWDIGDHDFVIDIGANVGVFTVFAARKTQETVLAFEPIPGVVEFLKRNILVNDLHNAMTTPAAVSDKIGSQKLFFLPLFPLSMGALFDHNYMNRKLERCIEVPTTTLRKIIDDSRRERIDFLKLDCEGSEGSILMSTPITYLKRIGKIAMEFHDTVSPTTHHDLRRLLEEAGFRTDVRWNVGSPFGYLYAKRE